MAWEHFEHAADVGVRGRGDTPARAFGEAARALFSLLSADLDRIRPSDEERVECDAVQPGGAARRLPERAPLSIRQSPRRLREFRGRDRGSARPGETHRSGPRGTVRSGKARVHGAAQGGDVHRPGGGAS